MRPATDHSQPQKRRRFENSPVSPSMSTTQNQTFLNGTILLPPRHPGSGPQQSNPTSYANSTMRRQPLSRQVPHQLSFSQSNSANPHHTLQNGQLGPTTPTSDLVASNPFPQTNANHHQQNQQNMHMPFGNPSAPLQTTTTTTSRQQRWPPQQQPSAAPDFSASGVFDDIFTGADNATTNQTATTQNRDAHPSLNTQGLSSNAPYPAVLPPLASGAPPPLDALDPFTSFSAIESTFPNSAPLQPNFLGPDPLANLSASSPAGISTSYPLQGTSTMRTPSMRQRIGPRTPNGLSPGHHLNFDTSQPSPQQFHVQPVLPPRPGITPMGNTIRTNSGSLSLRSMPAVKKALDMVRDGTPVLVALAQTIMQTNNISVPPTIQRNRILDFTGFPRNLDPKCHWLASLSKSDLDILAWIFVVSKHGRKEDVARRIVSSLRAPLKLRVPTQAKKPGIPTRADARGTSLSTLAAVMRTVPQTTRTSSTRSNMPSLAPAPALSPRGDSILSNLQRQLGPGSIRGTTALSPAPISRVASQHHRSKQMQSLCSEVLQGYTFDVGENPFNNPMNAPLGVDPYAVFSSVQLSRGNNDPVLRFQTPAPIEKSARPEVEGGDVQVHLRCLRVEIEKPKSEWKQAWPFPATCRVNGHSVTLNQAQRYTNGKLAGRDAATNITPFLRKYKKTGAREMNKVVLRRQASTATAAAGQYVFLAQEILVLSHETMTKSVFETSEKYWVDHRANLEKKGEITPSTSKFEMARQGVMQFLTDPDGLTVSSMKVSLRCPLALTRIATPVKGRKCQHVQCFDLENFLEYARRSSKFDCPVCNKNTAFPAMLVISPYIEHALATFKDCDEVEINQDGSMVEVERKQTGVASDDDEDDNVKTEPRKLSSRPHGAAATGVAGAPEIVDLTLDSDDEGGPEDNEARQSASVPPEVDTSIALLSGDQMSIDGPSFGPQVNHGGSSSPLEQDMFSFRADFCWREPQIANSFATTPARIQQTQVDSVRENWASDVIAIDSD